MRISDWSSDVCSSDLRLGTAEIYRAVEELPEILDSLVIDLEFLGRDSYMPLFVVLRPGLTLDAVLKERINQAIRAAVSARFVPNDIFQEIGRASCRERVCQYV